MSRESIYWFIVLLTFFYIFSKNRNNTVKVLIILCFYFGLATSLGRGIENLFKIVLVLFSVYILLKHNGLFGLGKKESVFLFMFILFSLSYFYSAFVNNDYFTLVFSQYGKYFTPVCLFFVFNRVIIKNPKLFINLKDLLFSMLTIQIILSVVKVLTLDFQESIVGSIAYIGGGLATIIPPLGFIFLWVDKNGEFNRKDWIYTLLLFFIGIASLKRAILFIMPAVIFLFMYYVPRKINFSKFLYVLPLLLLLFYVGVRLNPSLNRENKMGGSFDLHFVIDYANSYTLGKTEETKEVQLGTGRGGATLLLWSNLFNEKTFTPEDYWGSGLQKVYTVDYEQFDENNFGVNSLGSVTGVFQSYIFSGFVGIFMTILLLISVIRLIKEPRIRIVIGLLIFWDYLFYSGLILRSQAVFILLFFIIHYSNQQFREKTLRIMADENQI